jgi:hypothetical protein
VKKKITSLKNITPKLMSCAAIGCSSIYKSKDGSYIIIGKLAHKSVIKELKNAISEGEVAIRVPKGLLENLRTK